jgi:hypothetical protein
MSYYTGSISTGKLTATTVTIYPDASNSIAAGLQAVEVNTSTLTAGTVNATVFNFEQANLDVSNNLVVGGNTLLNNLHVTGTVQMDNLVIDSSNSFFNAMAATTATIGTLNVTGNSNLKATDVSGNLGVRGTTSLKGTNVAGVLDVSGNLGVRGTANLAGTNVVGVLAVTGNETVSGTLGVTGVSNLAGTNVVGTLAVTGSETVSGSVTAGSLSVAGTTVDTSANLVVVGSTSVQSLNVAGTGYIFGGVTLADNLAVLKNEYLGGNMYANNGVVIGDSSNGTGVVLSVASGTTVLAVTGSETVSGTLGVTGVSTLAGTNVVGTLAVTGSETVSGSVTAGSLSASGAVTAGSLSVADTTVDTLGNLVVGGSTSVQSLNVEGTGYFLGGVTLEDNLAVLANEYLGGNMYANMGITIGDSFDGTGVALSVATGTTVLAVTGSETVSGTLGVSGVSTLAGTNVVGTLAVTGSETVSGSVTAAGAVTAGSLSVAGTTVDTSGNLVVGGSTTVNSLEVTGTASFDESVNVTGNEAVQGGFYTEGGSYFNNNLVVGDGSEGDGVTMHSSGTTLNVFGVTQDSSAILFPITMNIQGDITVGAHLISGTPAIAPTVTDSSNVTGTPTVTGSDLAGVINFQPDTVNPPYITIAFGVNYTNPPIVMISPANIYAATGGDLGYISNVSNSGFRLNITGNGTANTYGFNYFVIGK